MAENHVHDPSMSVEPSDDESISRPSTCSFRADSKSMGDDDAGKDDFLVDEQVEDVTVTKPGLVSSSPEVIDLVDGEEKVIGDENLTFPNLGVIPSFVLVNSRRSSSSTFNKTIAKAASRTDNDHDAQDFSTERYLGDCHKSNSSMTQLDVIFPGRSNQGDGKKAHAISEEVSEEEGDASGYPIPRLNFRNCEDPLFRNEGQGHRSTNGDGDTLIKPGNSGEKFIIGQNCRGDDGILNEMKKTHSFIIPQIELTVATATVPTKPPIPSTKPVDNDATSSYSSYSTSSSSSPNPVDPKKKLVVRGLKKFVSTRGGHTHPPSWVRDFPIKSKYHVDNYLCGEEGDATTTIKPEVKQNFHPGRRSGRCTTCGIFSVDTCRCCRKCQYDCACPTPPKKLPDVMAQAFGGGWIQAQKVIAEMADGGRQVCCPRQPEVSGEDEELTRREKRAPIGRTTYPPHLQSQVDVLNPTREVKMMMSPQPQAAEIMMQRPPSYNNYPPPPCYPPPQMPGYYPPPPMYQPFPQPFYYPPPPPPPQMYPYYNPTPPNYYNPYPPEPPHGYYR